MLPRITLVTPSFQQAAFLEECLASVHAQGYPDLEHIVVDGGSTDGSKAIIERYADKLAWWCSEADGGQSAAINKGLARATGQVFAWLNSDDMLLPGALHTVGQWFAEQPEAWAHRGRLEYHDGTRVKPFPSGPFVDDEHGLYLDPLVVQPSTFFRTDALKSLGGVEVQLHCIMDLELQWQLLFREGPSGLHSHDERTAIFREQPASKSATLAPRFRAEQAALLVGMLRNTGSNDLAEVLSHGRVLPTGLRAIPVPAEMAARVRRMAIHFLLKWDHAIMDREQFERMRMLRDLVPLANEQGSDPGTTAGMREKAWSSEVDAQLAAGSWWAFRARRKWRHITRRR
jgi:hypothetical protein